MKRNSKTAANIIVDIDLIAHYIECVQSIRHYLLILSIYYNLFIKWNRIINMPLLEWLELVEEEVFNK